MPRSSQLITQDNEYGLYAVSMFKKVTEEFKLHAREKKFIVRDFVYNEEELAAGKNEITKLVTDKKKQFVSFLFTSVFDSYNSDILNAPIMYLYLSVRQVFTQIVPLSPLLPLSIAYLHVKYIHFCQVFSTYFTEFY